MSVKGQGSRGLFYANSYQDWDNMNNDIVIWLKNVTFVTTDVIKIIIAYKEWM